jgi:hypothetical protein
MKHVELSDIEMRIGGPEPPSKQPTTLSHRTSNSNMPILFHLKSMRKSKFFIWLIKF